VTAFIAFNASFARSDDAERMLTLDHYVRVQSSVPSIKGQPAQIYVREKVKAGTVLRSSALADRVVVFVHGAGTPGSVAFDVSYPDYSWMGYLAQEGFDTFAMDFTGYGRSTRPPAMNGSVQSLVGAAGRLYPQPPICALYADVSTPAHNDRLGLGRPWSRRRLRPAPQASRSREPRGLVARRAALGRFCGTSSGEDP
jgi:pimeloyl-ACP methyl ester carboxylesterase